LVSTFRRAFGEISGNLPPVMKNHPVKINSIQLINHDVLRIATDKPEKFTYQPGQATGVLINKPNSDAEKSPFTFTSLATDEDLEFTIKTYPKREGMTSKLLELKRGDELILHEVFGTITYQGEGVFIAGGAGVTPFVAIFRQLKAEGKLGKNLLIVANKKEHDIILAREFKKMLGDKFINILSEETSNGYAHGRISTDFLKKYITPATKHVYVCGPPQMVTDMVKKLQDIGVNKEAIVTEKSA